MDLTQAVWEEGIEDRSHGCRIDARADEDRGCARGRGVRGFSRLLQKIAKCGQRGRCGGFVTAKELSVASRATHDFRQGSYLVRIRVTLGIERTAFSAVECKRLVNQ